MHAPFFHANSPAARTLPKSSSILQDHSNQDQDKKLTAYQKPWLRIATAKYQEIWNKNLNFLFPIAGLEFAFYSRLA